jgi:hypothetical protein
MSTVVLNSNPPASINACHSLIRMSLASRPNAVFRFAWVMRNGDDVALEGIDFGELDPDGRIKRIVGFFGPFPPLDV